MDDLISRQAAIDALETVGYDFSESELSEVELEEVCGAVGDVRQDMIGRIKRLPSAEPKRETATVSVGKSKGGATMWYECAACGEPVDQGDTFCSGCGRRMIHG